VAVATDAAGAFTTQVMIPSHFGGGELTLKVVDQLPRFTGPTDVVLVQRPTAQPAGPSVGVSGRRHFWRG
jgi:hypothetical protein